MTLGRSWRTSDLAACRFCWRASVSSALPCLTIASKKAASAAGNNIHGARGTKHPISPVIDFSGPSISLTDTKGRIKKIKGVRAVQRSKWITRWAITSRFA